MVLFLIPGLLLGVNVPDYVVREANDLVAGPLGHLGKALGLSLVLKRIAGEVYSYEIPLIVS